MGFLSLFVMIAGMSIGYVLFLLGLTIYFDMSVLESDALTALESLTVTFVGVGLIVLGYFGWRGFNYFAY